MTERPYNVVYPARLAMTRFDARSGLYRWFENYKLDRDEEFADREEWLTIEEIPFKVGSRRRVRYVGEIGSDCPTHFRRYIEFETGAPPPPSFFRPAPEPYQPIERRPSRTFDNEPGVMTAHKLLHTVEKLGLRAAPPNPFDLSGYDTGFEFRAMMEQRTRLLNERIDALSYTFYAPLLVKLGEIINPDEVREVKPPPPPRWRRN